MKIKEICDKVLINEKSRQKRGNRMEQSVIIYKEKYADLPGRFVNRIDHDLQYLIQRDIPGIKKVYLFGSCARGEVRSSSDVDLLVVTEKKLKDRMLAADIRWTLDEPIDGVRTDIVYRNEETQAESSVFNTLLERDKILILEVRK